MNIFPFEIITGSGLGTSYSSINQIGTINPIEPFGKMGMKLFYNISSGNIIIKDRPVVSMEFGIPQEINFIYNSQAVSAQDAWRLNVKKIKQFPSSSNDNSAILIEEDGHLTPLAYDKDTAAYFAPKFKSGTPYLKYDSTINRWIIFYQSDQSKELYTSNGQLEQRIDQAGRITRLEYDAWGNLTAITGPSLNRYEIIRNDNTVSINLVVGTQKVELQKCLIDESGLTTTLPNGNNVKYLYYGIKGNYDYKRILSVTESNGTTLNLVFDPSQHPQLSRVRAGSANTFNISRNDSTISIQAAGRTAGFQIDNQSRISVVTRQTGFDNSGIPDLTKYGYDNYNHFVSLTLPDNSIESSSYEYPVNSEEEKLGLIKWHTLPNGNAKLFYYDRVQVLKLPLVTEVLKTALNSKDYINTHKVYDYNYNKANAFNCVLRFEISAMGRITEYLQNSRGLVEAKRVYTKIRFPLLTPDAVVTLSNVISFLEDIKKQDPNYSKNITLSAYQYDRRGQLTRTYKFATIDNDGNGIADEMMSLDKTLYSDEGNLLSHSFKQLPDQETDLPTSIINYDSAQRVIKVEDPLNQNTKTSYDEANSTVTKTFPNNAIEIQKFDNEGLLSLQQNIVGEVTRDTRFVRNPNGLIIRIDYPNGITHFPLYDKQNREGFLVTNTGIIKETNYNSQCRFIQTKFYKNQVVMSEIMPEGEASPVLALLLDQIDNNPELKNSYRSSYKFMDINGRALYEVDANNYIIQSLYDLNKNVIARISYALPITIELLDQLKTGKSIILPTDAKDRVWQYYYDNDSVLIGQKDPAGYVTEYKNDNAGRTYEVIKYATPVPGINKEFLWFTSESDNHTYKFFDARSQNTFEVDAESYITQKEYLPCGLLYKETRYAIKINKSWFQDTTAIPVPTPSSKDKIIKYQYDRLNREIQSTDSLNKKINSAFDVMGNEVLMSQANKNRNGAIDGDNIRQHREIFDGWNELVAEANPFVSQQILEIENSTLPPELKKQKIADIWQNSSTRHVYSPNGIKLYSLDPLSNKTIYYYDRDLRPIIIIDPVGAIIQNTLDVFGNVTAQRKYYTKIDANTLSTLTGGIIDANLLKILDNLLNNEKDSVTLTKFDNRDQAVSVIDPEHNQTDSSYNAFRQCEYEILPINTEKGAPRLIIEREFEQRGLETSTTKISDTKKICKVQRYDNSGGKLTDIIDEVGSHTQYQLDKLDRTYETSQSVEPNTYIVTETLELDAFDQITQKTDADNVLSKINYIPQENSKEVTFPLADNSKTIILENVFGDLAQTMVTTADSDKILKQESFTHAPDGQVQTHTDGVGNRSTTDFDTNGRTAAETDPSKIVTSFQRNAAGDLTKKIIDSSSTGLQLTTEMQPNAFKQNEIVINPRRVVTKNTFDGNSNLQLSILDYGTGTLNSSLALSHNAQGVVTDSLQGTMTINRRIKNVIDGFNRLIKVIRDPLNLMLTTEYYRNDLGNIIKEIDPNGNTKRTFYNLLQQNRYEVKALDNNKIIIIERQYTKAGKLSSIRTYQPIPKGLIDDNTNIAEIAAKVLLTTSDTITLYFYDKKGREQYKVSLIYVLESNDYQAGIEEKQYDPADRESKITYFGTYVDATNYTGWTTDSITTLLVSITDHSKDRFITKFYDEASEQRITINQDGVINSSLYDKNNRKISESVIAASTELLFKSNLTLDEILSKLAIETEKRTKYFVYDSCGRIRFIVKQDNSVIRKSYDQNNNVIQVCRYSNSLPPFQSYEELVVLLNSNPPIDPKDSFTNTAYDNADRVSSIKDALGFIDNFARDALGNTNVHTDKRGFDWSYGFDTAERMTMFSSPVTTTVSVSRDENGKLIYIKNNNISVTKKTDYDKTGNPISITEGYNSSEPRVINFNYDPSYNLISTEIPDVLIDDESEYTPEWDNLKKLPQKNVSITTKTVFNANGKVICECNESNVWSFKIYDSAERLVFEIINQSALKKYSYNPFNEITEEIAFSNSVSADFDYTPNLLSGLQLRDISIDPANPAKINILPDSQDRKTLSGYDNNGNLISIKKSSIIYYHNGEKGTAQPEMIKKYNPFGDCIYEATLITPTQWARKISWYDKCGRVLAILDENNYVTHFMRDTSGRIVFKSEYSNAIPASTTINIDMTIEELIKLVVLDPIKDRFTRTGYDNAGNKISETLVGVVVQELVLDEKTSVPTIKTLEKTDLSKTWSYNANQQTISVTYEDGLSAYKYYDERGNLIGETNVSRTDPLGSPPLVITPYTAYLQSTHSQPVVKQTSSIGCVLPNKDNVPLFADPTKIVAAIKLIDNRGLETINQDEVGALIANTFTTTKKILRTLQPVSQWIPDGSLHTPEDVNEEPDSKSESSYSMVENDSKEEVSANDSEYDHCEDFAYQSVTNRSDPEYANVDQQPAPISGSIEAPAVTFTRVPILTQNKYSYDRMQRPIYQAYLSKGILEQTTYSRYNIFGDFIAESADNINWDAMQKFDTSGNSWFTNLDKGAGTIIFYDLRGKESLRAKAPQLADDLSAVGYVNILSLLDWDAIRLNRSESIRDFSGHVIAHRAPIWYKDRNMLPTCQYSFDRWSNTTSEIDSFGNVTDNDYNFRSNLLKRTDPLVTSTDASGLDSVVRPVTEHGYSSRGFEFATVDPNGHTEAYLLDEAGQWLIRILADGVRSEKRRLDALSRIYETRDSLDHATSFEFTDVNLVSSSLSPSGFSTKRLYDEKHDLAYVSDPVDASDPFARETRYNNDVRRNCVDRFIDLGNRTSSRFDRNSQYLSIVNCDGSMNLWDRDYFSNENSFKDLDGRINRTDYDGTKSKVRVYSDGSLTWPSYVFSFPVEYYDEDPGHLYPIPTYQIYGGNTGPKDIRSIYTYGLLDSTTDYGMEQFTQFYYNTESMRIRFIVSSTRDNMMLYDVMTNWDALQRETNTVYNRYDTSCFYNQINTTQKYDTASNVRMFSVWRDKIGYGANCVCSNPPEYVEYWSDYDAVSRPILVDGLISNGQIILIPNRGFGISYANDLRINEYQLNRSSDRLSTDLFYSPEGWLNSTVSTSGLSTDRGYLANGMSNRYQEIYPGHNVVVTVGINRNNYLIGQTVTDNNVLQSSSDYTNFLIGVPQYQTLKLYQDGREVKTRVFTFEYIRPGTTNQLAKTYSNDGPIAEYFFNANAILNGKYNSQDEPPLADGEVPRVFFGTVTENFILSKHYTINADATMDNNRDKACYFVPNVNGQIKGGFWNECNYLDRYYHYAYHVDDDWASGIHPELSTFKHLSTVRPIGKVDAEDPLAKNDPLGWDKQPFPNLGPQIYTVNSGETIESIALGQCGDILYADVIARLNGLPNAQMPVKAGHLLRLPQFIANRNKATNARPYNDFLNVIVGSLIPNSIVLPPPKASHHHSSWFKELIKVIAVGILIALAPELGTFALSTLGITNASLTLAAIATGISAALGDAVIQQIAMLTGVQTTGFSFTEVIETGVSAGSMSFIGGVAETPEQLAIQALKIGTIQVNTQLAEMALGLRSQFDAKAVGVQIAATLVASQINKAVVSKISGNNVAKELASNTISNSVSSVIGSTITRTPFSLQQIAINSIGSTAGNTAGESLSKSITSAGLSVPDDEKPAPKAPTPVKSSYSSHQTIQVKQQDLSLPQLDFSDPSTLREAKSLLGTLGVQDHIKSVSGTKTKDDSSVVKTPSTIALHSTSRISELLNLAANSTVVTAINTVGNSLNPFVQGPLYIDLAYRSFRAGNIIQGINASAGVALNVIPFFREFEIASMVAISSGASALNRLSLFGTRELSSLTSIQNIKAFITAKIGSNAEVASNLRGAVLKPGMYEMNPKEIRFNQSTVSTRFENNTRVDQLSYNLRRGLISPYEIKPIRIYQKDDKFFTIDNRRLLAFSGANINKIPVEIVSLKDPAFAHYEARWDPINGEGTYVAAVSKKERNYALELLIKHNLINGRPGLVK